MGAYEDFLQATQAAQPQAQPTLLDQFNASLAAKPSVEAPTMYANRNINPMGSTEVAGMAGVGHGLGNVVLNAQSLLGKGFNVLGYPDFGSLFTEDAAKGHQAIDAQVAPYAEQHPTATSAGDLAGAVAGTYPIGGMIGKAAEVVAPAFGPLSPYAAKLAESIKSGGMNLGGNPSPTIAGKALDMGLRSFGGGINGYSSAGLVDPESANSGGIIGAALPPTMLTSAAGGKWLAGKMGDKYAEALQAFNRNAPLNDTIRNSINAGYTIPPNMVNPSFMNQMIESVSGKQATQQLASVKNNDVTGSLVRKSLGLAEEAPLNVSVLENLRKGAGTAYQDVAAINPAAAAELEALKQARNDSQAWFKSYNRSASPDDLAKAKSFRATADQLETSLENHAATAGQPDLIPLLRDARKQIAKTYSVERALKDASGNVDARVLARMYEKGAPLEGDMLTAAKFASAFPTIAKSTEQIGSPAAHNMKAIVAGLMGVGGYMGSNDNSELKGAAAAAIPFIMPPAARAVMFRNGAQQALIPHIPQIGYAQQLAELLSNPQAQMLLSKSAPAISAALGR